MLRINKKASIGAGSVLCISILAFFLAACGIDVYYMLEPPTGNYRTPEDPAERYLEFNTNYNANTELLPVYQGVMVYYRLYNSESQMNSDISSINASNSEYSSNGANKMISIGYQPLRSQKSGGDFVARQSGIVQIRFFTEGQSATPYKAAINLNGNPIDIPLRYNKADGFDFFSDNDDIKDDEPTEESDPPDAYTGGTEQNIWYLNAYAVSFGRDENFTNLYSQLLHLGYITIQPE